MQTIVSKRAYLYGLCALLSSLVLVTGCGRTERDGHDGHGGHAEEAEGKAGGACGSKEACGDTACASSPSDGDAVLAKCEHDVPIYQCAECRYEVGVVKVDCCLLEQGGGALVLTQLVGRAKVSEALPVTGEVALDENAAVHISPRIAGVIESVSTDLGARVKQSDILLTVASVELGRALAEHERNRALVELAERTYLREKGLREQKVGSEQDMIEAQVAYEQQRAELRASEQMLHVLGLTEEDLAGVQKFPHGPGAGSLPVRAPIAGTIVEKHAVVGELAEPGKEVLLLADLSKVWVWLNVHARDLARLVEAEKRGVVPLEISVAAYPGRRFSGVVNYVGATMSEQTRTVRVRAVVENREFALRPGMFCEATIALAGGVAEDVLAVPRVAVLSDEGKTFVFKHWKDDYFIRQDVRTGRTFYGAVEILDGLKGGETVVTEGSFLLKSDVLREKMGAGCAD